MSIPTTSSWHPRRRSVARAALLARLRAERFPNLTRELTDARAVDPAERYRTAVPPTKEGK